MSKSHSHQAGMALELWVSATGHRTGDQMAVLGGSKSLTRLSERFFSRLLLLLSYFISEIIYDAYLSPQSSKCVFRSETGKMMKMNFLIPEENSTPPFTLESCTLLVPPLRHFGTVPMLKLPECIPLIILISQEDTLKYQETSAK